MDSPDDDPVRVETCSDASAKLNECRYVIIELFTDIIVV
jgi:hypothetical protein